MAAKYDEFCIVRQPMCEPEKTLVEDKLNCSITSEANANDESYLYEILVLSDECEAKADDDIDADGFELLEVTQSESNATVVSIPVGTPNDEPDEIQVDGVNDTADKIKNTVETNVDSGQDHVRRSARISRASNNSKRPAAKRKTRKAKAKAVEVIVQRPQCEELSLEYVVDELNDNEPCDEDNELVEPDSENDEWPAQGTFDDFPKDIIRDGLIQIKGDQMMSLISR